MSPENKEFEPREKPEGFDDYEMVEPKINYWNPKEEGEEIEGIFIKTYTGRRHERYILQVLEPDPEKEGELVQREKVMPDTLYIRNTFEQYLKIGMRVKVRFAGSRQTASGNTIYSYAIGIKTPPE